MTLAAVAPRDDRKMMRMAVALGALAVAAIVVFGLGALISGAVPAAPKNPFGVGIREAAQGGSGIGRWLLMQQDWFNRQMLEGLKEARDHDGFAFGMILLAFLYGVFHAGGPGHGKAVISAYLIANEETLWRGIALSIASALLQALIAIAIVLGATLILRATATGMTRLTDWVEIAAFAAIALFGLALTWRKAGPVAARLTQARLAGRAMLGQLRDVSYRRRDDHAHSPDQGHGHQDLDAGSEHPAQYRSNHEYAHDHDGLQCCDHHVPVEFVQSQTFRWRDAAPVVFAAGSRPCSGAIIILVFALSQGLLAAGLAAVFAMAVGVAITVSALATLSVFAKRLAQRFAGGEGRYALAGATVELLAAGFVATPGCRLMRGLAMISAG